MKKKIMAFAIVVLLVGGYAVSSSAFASAAYVEVSAASTKVTLVKFSGNMRYTNSGTVEERDGKLYVTGLGETNVAQPCSRGEYNYCVTLGKGTWYFTYYR